MPNILPNRGTAMGKKNLTKSTTNTKKNANSRKTTKKPSLKTLRKKKFETWRPETPYVPAPAPNGEKNFSAPELTGDYDPAEAEKIRALLFRDVSLNAPAPEKEVKGAKEAVAETPAETEGAGAATQEKEQSEKPEKEQTSDNKSSRGGEEPPRSPGPGGGGGGDWEPPVSRGLLGLIAAVILIFALLISASINNKGNYFLKETNTGLEIWRGDFSPNGREKIVTLPGVKAPEPEKDKYTREEALEPAFQSFMEKADEVAETRDLPNLNAIRDNLEIAEKYATTEKQKKKVSRRLDRINFLMLLYRADVAAKKQTRQGYETALETLEQAEELNLAEDDRQTLQHRITRIQKEVEELNQEPENTDDNK